MNTPMVNRMIGCSPRMNYSRGKSLALLMLLSLVATALLSGCGKPPALINRFILNYTPPVVAKSRPLDAGIKVQLFAVDETINRDQMVYQVNQFLTGTYQFNRWRANPGFLVTDYLTRDLQASKLFTAVFPYDRSGIGRFRLEGGVVQFQENSAAGGWRAVLALTITLLDADEENIAKRVLFQKSYFTQEPMPAKTPEGLADAMSRAMQKVSRRIIEDVYQAVKTRLGAGGPC